MSSKEKRRFRTEIEKNRELAANIIGGLICAIVCVRFSSSYFTYALVLFILFALYDLWKYRGSGRLGMHWKGMQEWCIGIVLFYGLCFVSGLLLQDMKSMKEAGDYATLTIPFFMMYFLRSNHDIDIGVKWGLLAGMAIICGGAFWGDKEIVPGRMQSFFLYPNILGTGLAILLPFSVYYLVKSRNIAVKTILATLVLLILYCFYGTESRGAMMALMVAGSAVLLILAWQQRTSFSKKFLAAAGIAAMIIFAGGIGAIYQISSERSGAGKIGGERMLMMEASYDMWKDHKLAGVGLANWQKSYYSERYHPQEGREEGLLFAHNTPLHFFATAGILGGIDYLIFFILPFWAMLKALMHAKDKWFVAAVLTSFLAIHIHGLVDATFINKIPLRIFFLLMGYSAAVIFGGGNSVHRQIESGDKE